jgi:SAM-dependent methyltransferase
VAVEPTAALREAAMALHSSPRIAWVDDGLPRLAGLGTARFDLAMLTAVWMHLDRPERQAAMPRLAGLLHPGGRLVLSLRHGPVPPGRRMFEVTAEETVALAAAAGLRLLLRLDRRPGARARPGVCWTRLGFEPAA